ncbi:MAG: hypothetical protein Q7J26_10765 [Brevundimonas sp.]|uniref:hypothetical protein n=1 Tax=Brevundimonas sp. TaxID=1871086 RepID=UPI002716B249|nr:hypothetical protein [Brevundimonas sp.]MDO9608996.1 hypothetical protein [Brevundimonas sp.]
MLKAILAAAALATAASPAIAWNDDVRPMSNEAVAESRPMVDGFFQTLKAGDSAKAYADLFDGTLMATKTMEIQNLVAQTNFIFQTYGSITHWSLVKSDCISPNLCQTTYQVDTNNGPVIMLLTLYRRPSGWMPTTIYITDVTQALFN